MAAWEEKVQKLRLLAQAAPAIRISDPEEDPDASQLMDRIHAITSEHGLKAVVFHAVVTMARGIDDQGVRYWLLHVFSLRRNPLPPPNLLAMIALAAGAPSVKPVSSSTYSAHWAWVVPNDA